MIKTELPCHSMLLRKARGRGLNADAAGYHQGHRFQRLKRVQENTAGDGRKCKAREPRNERPSEDDGTKQKNDARSAFIVGVPSSIKIQCPPGIFRSSLCHRGESFNRRTHVGVGRGQGSAQHRVADNMKNDETKTTAAIRIFTVEEDQAFGCR
jgi:hypothetical protein